MKLVNVLMLPLMIGITMMTNAVTIHTIINSSDRRVHGWVGYYGEIKGFSCRTDEGYIEPGDRLVSNARSCVVRFFQIQDGKNTVVPDPYKILKIEVGSQPPGELFFGAPTIRQADGSGLAFVVTGNSTWEYNGQVLTPVKGVVVYEVPNNIFARLKIIAVL